MSLGPWQIALIVLLALIFFGRGRISEMMGDVGKGIRSFKKGLSEAEEEDAKDKAPQKRIEDKSGAAGTGNIGSHDKSAS